MTQLIKAYKDGKYLGYATREQIDAHSCLSAFAPEAPAQKEEKNAEEKRDKEKVVGAQPSAVRKAPEGTKPKG